MNEQADLITIKDSCTPLLGNHTLHDMNLLHLKFENILAVSNYTPITKEQLFAEYKPVFDGIVRLEGDYHLVGDKSIPPVVHPRRKVPIALKAQLKGELDHLENLNIITQLSEPTHWVSSCLMVLSTRRTWTKHWSVVIIFTHY